MNPGIKNLKARSLIVFAALLLLGVTWTDEAAAQKVRIAMPAKSMTFLNFYVGDKFGAYKAEGFEVSLEVIKTEVGVAGMVAGEIDYTSAIGTAMRAAATGVPMKAAMFTMDRVMVYMYAKPSIKSIEELKAARQSLPPVWWQLRPTPPRRWRAPMDSIPTAISLSFSPAMPAIRSRHCSAGRPMWRCCPCPSTSKLKRLGFRNLGNAIDYLQTPFAGLGVTEAKIKNNPAQVKRMIRATLKSVEFTRDPANQEKVVGLLIDEFKLERKAARLALRDIIKAFSKDGTTSEDAVKSEIRDIREQAKIKAEMPVSQLVDYKLLEEVLAEIKR